MISLACISSKTSLSASHFSSSYLGHKRAVVVPGVPSGDGGNWEYESLTEAMHVL